MKVKLTLAALCACVLAGYACAEETKPAEPKPPTAPAAPAPAAPGLNKERDSLAIGLYIGSSLKKTPDDIDLDSVIKGLKEAFSDKQSMTEQEVTSTVQNFQMAMMKKESEKAKGAGEKFLAENKTKEGVQTTASGLQYKVITEGKGDKPKATDTAMVQYKGTLIDGTEFDSSYKHGGKPVSFPINRVIPGWTEGLQLMTPGSKYMLYIPSHLAYGENPPPGSGIQPNAVLIFEVELVGVQPAGAGAGGGMNPQGLNPHGQ